MKKSILLFLAGALVLTGCMSAATKQGYLKKDYCRIARIDYRGWKDCYRMSNGLIEIVVVPAIGGRIMTYSLNNTNVIYENPAEFGKTYPPVKGVWRNFGGYKVWPAPQTWWPPEPVLDSAESRIEILSPSSLRIIGAPSPEAGLQYIKDVTIYPGSSQVTILQKMINVSNQQLERSIWDVTQVKVPGRVIFSLNPKSVFPEKIKYWDAEKILSKQLFFKNGLVLVKYDGSEGKLGADSPSGWIAYQYQNLTYLKKFQYFPGEKYPDDGCTVEVWANTEPPYVEVEVLSPLKTLEPGQSYIFTEDWYLYETPGFPEGDAETIAEIKSLVEK